jgi:tetratricopeptide (TPR) repeat protein
MRCALVVWLAIAVATPAFADDQPPVDVDAALVRIRAHFQNAEYEAAKQLLLSTYASSKRADLLFALGQAEYNLGHYAAAIDYYEQYLATGPAADAVALAHQAIGSARARLDAPIVKPLPPPVAPPPPPRRVRDWDGVNTAFVVAGSAITLAGGAWFAAGYRAGTDRSGSLAQYDRRLDRSLRWQRGGVVVAAGGVALVAAALVRWRVRRIEIAPVVSASSGAGVTVGGAW